MILAFSKERYMERILSGVKIHTIRKDPQQRWRVGMTCHMWMHSPRNVSKNPFQFAEAEVSEVKQIEIIKDEIKTHVSWFVEVDSKSLTFDEVQSLAIADGFDSAEEFIDWFGEFSGRLIFFKNLRRVGR